MSEARKGNEVVVAPTGRPRKYAATSPKGGGSARDAPPWGSCRGIPATEGATPASTSSRPRKQRRGSFLGGVVGERRTRSPHRPLRGHLPQGGGSSADRLRGGRFWRRESGSRRRMASITGSERRFCGPVKSKDRSVQPRGSGAEPCGAARNPRGSCVRTERVGASFVR